MSKNQRLLVELSLLQLCSEAQSPFFSDEKKNTSELIPPPYLSKTTNRNTKAEYNTPPQNGAISSVNEKLTPSIEKTSVAGNTIIQPKANYPVIEIEKGVPVKMGGFRKGLIENNPSIKDLRAGIVPTEKKEEVIVNIVSEPDIKNEFTEQELNTAWNKYALILQEKGEINLFNTISHNVPVLLSDFTIEITLSNSIQEKEFNTHKADLITYLKKELNNYALKLITKVDETISVKFAYTANDKLKQLMEKNPLLLKLKQSLDLDFEY